MFAPQKTAQNGVFVQFGCAKIFGPPLHSGPKIGHPDCATVQKGGSSHLDRRGGVGMAAAWGVPPTTPPCPRRHRHQRGRQPDSPYHAGAQSGPPLPPVDPTSGVTSAFEDPGPCEGEQLCGADPLSAAVGPDGPDGGGLPGPDGEDVRGQSCRPRAGAGDPSEVFS